jgi:predicted DNA binding CopG/RHH family protein
MSNVQVEDTQEAWENEQLGCDLEHAKVASSEDKQKIEDILGMQAISIRLSKDLIKDFKTMATIHGVGYQPLMRDALQRFATAEFKRLAVEMYNAQITQKEVSAEDQGQHQHRSQKKAA